MTMSMTVTGDCLHYMKPGIPIFASGAYTLYCINENKE